jgi:hypothetical protein
VSKPVSAVIAFNVVTPMPGPEPVSALCPADGVHVSWDLPAASHSYHSSFNMLEVEEADDDSVCVRVRERLPELVNAGVRPVALVEGRGGLGGGSFVYRPAQFIDREIIETGKRGANDSPLSSSPCPSGWSYRRAKKRARRRVGAQHFDREGRDACMYHLPSSTTTY